MASEKQIEANRRNAKRSTGPKSTNGKAIASRNAFRHGLASSRIFTVDNLERVGRLAGMISNASAGSFELEQATIIAECQILISLTRAARIELIEKMRTCAAASDFNYDQMLNEVKQGKLRSAMRRLKQATLAVQALHRDCEEYVSARRKGPSEGNIIPEDPFVLYMRPRNDVVSFELALPHLLALDRYERRALSRRRRAIAAISALQAVA